MNKYSIFHPKSYQKINKLKEPMAKIASQIPARVDINILLAKIREDKKKSDDKQ